MIGGFKGKSKEGMRVIYEKIIKDIKYKINNMSDVEFFNIKFSYLRNYTYKNILSFGDLIHKVHPLAGQGFNMTIRDIKIKETPIFPFLISSHSSISVDK